MGTHWGVDGVIKLGANTVAEIEEWDISDTVDPVVDTKMGDTAETHIPGSGIKKWSGTITCHYDETDALGQEAMTVGASLTGNFYPVGASPGDPYYTGLFSIVSMGISVKKDGDTIKRTFSIKGNGALTTATVGA